MKTAESLLTQLGVRNCTQRHLNIVNEFLKSGETDATELLDQLGGWDTSDLLIVESFLKTE